MFNRLKVSQKVKSEILKVKLKLGKIKLMEHGLNRKKKNHKEAILQSEKDPLTVQIILRSVRNHEKICVTFSRE